MILLLLPSLAGGTPPGTANIPVSDLLELHAAEDEAPAPPVAGILDRLVLSGRVLDDALEVRVDVEVSILAAEGWTEVPLMEVGPRVALAEVPRLQDAWLAVQGTTLTLIARKPGTHTFTVTATVAPTGPRERREARLRVHPATATSLELDYDPALVQISTPLGAGPLRPRDGQFQIAWRALGAPREAVSTGGTVVQEPGIPRAASSIVSTLEGTWLVRTHYDLRFEGARDLTVSWPEDMRLQRVYVNGVVKAIAPEGSSLTVPVAPARSGGDAGTLEVVLSGVQSGYLLQGSLDLRLPSVSWPVGNWTLSTHLPEVFNYSWDGGSMQQQAAGTPIPDPEFTYGMPTPGKATHWQQELVFTSAPSLRLGYTVDLEGAYFRSGDAPIR